MPRAMVTAFCLLAVLAPTVASATTRPQLDHSAQHACIEAAFYNAQRPGSSGRRAAVAYMAQVLQRSDSPGARVLARRLRAAHSPSARQSAVVAVTSFCVAGGHPPGPPFFLPR